MKNKSREKTNGCSSVPTVRASTVKHNDKLTDNDKVSIYLDYILNKNIYTINDLERKYNINHKIIYRIRDDKRIQELAKKEVDKVEKMFSAKSELIINKALDRINQELETNPNINISNLSTTLGILYDKNQLSKGLATSNNAININLKIEK